MRVSGRDGRPRPHTVEVLEPGVIGGLAAALVGTAALALSYRLAAGRSAELAEALDFSSEYSSSLDAGEILQRVLAAIVAMPGVDAGLVVLEGHDGRGVEALGLSDDEAERIALELPANGNLRSMEVGYRYRLDEVGEASNLPR